MRIVAGELRGRNLVAPRGQGTRPTAERVREALFSALGQQVAGARVADLFAGTGALGLEALSRGAAFADFFERDPRARRALEENIARCGVEARSRVHTAPLPRGLSAAEPWELVLMDPPWGKGLGLKVAEILGQRGLLVAGGTLMAEERVGQGGDPGKWRAIGFELTWERRYGDTLVRLFTRAAPGPR